MPAKPSQELMKFMELHGIDSDEIWPAPGGTAWAIKHRAIERVAAERKITFDAPTMIEHDSANGIVAMCVIGRMGDRSEWSIGEAAPKNNKNSYAYAMAEKRAKDRVALKLLNTTAINLLSDEEGDNLRQNPHVTRPTDVFEPLEYDQNGEVIDGIPSPAPEAVQQIKVSEQRPIFKILQDEIQATVSVINLKAWGEHNKDRLGKLKPEWREFLQGVYREHLAELRKQEHGDNIRMAG